MPFAVESGGEAQTSAVGAGVGEALPVPSHRSEILVWLSMTAHRAPFHPGGPLQMSPEVQGPTGTQGCHQGCQWLPGSLLSVFSLAAVSVQLNSALEASAMLRTTECL